MDGGAAAERWPGMRFEEAVLFQPDAGCCNADATVSALQRRAAVHGAEVLREAGPAVVEVAGDGVIARTSGGEWRAPVGVVACGSWASHVLRGLVVDLPPLLVTQEQVFYFEPRDAAGAWPSFIHHRTPYIYGLDTPGFGVKVAEHHAGAETDPDGRSFEVDEGGRGRVATYVDEWFPGLRPEPVAAETCLYTTTPTTDFVIDRVGALVVAAGFSGHGFKFTPLVGRLLADLALGSPGLERFKL
jgi:sarcosine oxidase